MRGDEAEQEDVEHRDETGLLVGERSCSWMSSSSSRQIDTCECGADGAAHSDFSVTSQASGTRMWKS